MAAVNALLLGSLMYRSGLVPRVIPLLGLIGAPLMISSALGQVVGINTEYSAWSAIALVPIFLWELTLGLWLVIKGFKPSAPIMVEADAAEAGGLGRPAQGPGPEALIPSQAAAA